VRRLLRDRNFRLLAAGQLLNQLGDHAMFLVLAIWVRDLTGSNSAAGLVFLLYAVPAVAAPFLGVYVDRVPRRPLLIATDLAAAIVVLSLLFVHDHGDVWLLYVVSLLYGLAGQIYFAARSGLLVSMLPQDQLADANGVLASIGRGVQLGGPLLGAALFTLVGGGVVAVLDAGTFVASVALLAPIRVRDLEPPAHRAGFAHELAAGIRHAWHTADIRRLVLVTAGILGIVGLVQGGVFALVDEGLHRDPSFLGVIASIQALGSIAGGLAAASVIRRIGELRAAGAGMFACGLGLGLLPFATMPTVLAGVIVIGAGLSVFLVAYNTLLQRLTEPAMQGRVFAAGEAATSLPYTISIGIGAALVAVVSFRLLFGVSAVGTALVSLMLFGGRPTPAPALVDERAA
jgi:MFS family permease